MDDAAASKAGCIGSPCAGGVQAQALLAARYPKSACYVVLALAEHAQVAQKLIAPAWWNPARWTGPAVHIGAPEQPAQMLWANMALHMAADPQALIAQWHQLLQPDGFLMFSCLGPDTLRELRALYAAQGWPPLRTHSPTCTTGATCWCKPGFAEPVMDMERITLSFASPERLLAELRELGRNLHPQRFGALRGRGWHAQLLSALSQLAQSDGDGQLRLSFEIVYGHAFKAPPRMAVAREPPCLWMKCEQPCDRVKKNNATG